LNVFHEEKLLRGRLPHQVFVPEETELLEGLEAVQRELLRKATRDEPPWMGLSEMPEGSSWW
jgi:hypothetical protein